MYPVKTRKKALTVGGSDSSGGAGVQADLKAFASIGVHGASVVTCITAQNTKGIQAIQPVDIKLMKQQFDSVATDLKPPVGKTGLLYNDKMTKAVATKFDDYEIELVVDPVMTSTTGHKLSMKNFLQALKSALLPVTKMVTPNLYEASQILGWEVKTLDDMIKAAAEISEFGPRYVLITGGHLEGEYAIDVLFRKRKGVRLFKAKKIPVEMHGTGCALSAMITAYLAIGKNVESSMRRAKDHIQDNIRHGYDIGGGIDVVDTHSHLFNAAEKFRILTEVKHAANRLEEILHPAFVPEVGVNIAYSLPYPCDMDDVCALQGRIIKSGDRILVAGHPEFGASTHIGRVVLTVSSQDHRFRSGMNISYSKKTVEACHTLTFKVSSFDRSEEPKGVRTMGWGTMKAIEEFGSVPDIIFDTGGHGKEPMIRILGNNPKEVVNKAKAIIEEVAPKKKKVRE
jgi:hydroxymethylpyrimidine/phosphomethylpyrimidine kinase